MRRLRKYEFFDGMYSRNGAGCDFRGSGMALPPVRIIGNWISILEKWLRGFCKNDEKKERIAGCVLWFGVVIASVGIPWGLLYLVGKVSFWLQFALETFWCYQLLAGKCLKDESRKVYVRLVNHNLEGARHAVSMIVGRDTGNLSEAGVTKAAVETVAENTSDGVIAPLIFMLIGGAPLGFFYKAVNTMDSMVGYKNEKYLHFGRFAAKMDDVWNYIPSRISALLMIASAWIFRMDYKRAWAVWKRDRRKQPARIPRRQKRYVQVHFRCSLREMPIILENYIRKRQSEMMCVLSSRKIF